MNGPLGTSQQAISIGMTQADFSMAITVIAFSAQVICAIIFFLKLGSDDAVPYALSVFALWPIVMVMAEISKVA